MSRIGRSNGQAVKFRENSQQSLEGLRQQIDHIDQELVALFEKRAQVVFAVGEYKRQNNLPVYDPAREARIKDRVGNLISENGPLNASEMATVFSKMVENFRLFESAHTQKQLAHAHLNETHIDFTQKQKVVIWGFGLLGASLCLALNEAWPHWNFLVVDPFIDVDHFEKWRKQNQMQNLDLMNPEQIHFGQIFVLAAPVEINEKNLKNASFPKGSWVFDVGSTKQSMQAAWETRKLSGKPCDFFFVGGHPLAGKEVAGFENADSNLFYNKTFCWSQVESVEESKAHAKFKKSCETLALSLGSQPFWVSAEDHDKALAWTSHLPQVLASVLSQCLSKQNFSRDMELFPGVVSELLRVSGSQFSMWKPILSSNHKSVKESLSELIKALQSTQNHIDSVQDNEKLFQDSNRFYDLFKQYKLKRGSS